jgi:endonuclease YncB( thermonuclease family)
MIKILLMLLLPVLTLADTLTGRIVGVHDGDTATLLTVGNQQVKIRLNQIDAPELGQAFGKRSK